MLPSSPFATRKLAVTGVSASRRRAGGHLSLPVEDRPARRSKLRNTRDRNTSLISSLEALARRWSR
jgi:hypothetical protein